MSWITGDNRNLFLKLKSKLGPHHVVLTTPETSREKLTLTVVETKQLPEIEKTNSKEEIYWLKWTIFNGRRKKCVNFQTDTDKLNIVVYPYRNNIYLKNNEVDLKLTEYQSLLAVRVYLLFGLCNICKFLYVFIVFMFTTILILSNRHDFFYSILFEKMSLRSR